MNAVKNQLSNQSTAIVPLKMLVAIVRIFPRFFSD